MTQPNVTTDMLHAFVDGQLDDAEMALVESYLAENPDRAEEVADWAAQNDAIRNLYPAPDMPIELPEITSLANTNRAPWRAIAASVAMLGIGIALGWVVRGTTPQNTEIQVAGLVNEA
ncbi:MAG TPA: hypothetical protein ENJ91_09760, partial [Rhodobacteraceae bacterium]|nr:hypothetical protein [Paracoccaceae bacterium]